MKEKTEDKFKIEPISKVIEEKVESIGHRGRTSRFPLMKIRKGFGLFLNKTEISSISPLVNYYNRTKESSLKCKTVVRDGNKGVFVYNPAKQTNRKEMAAVTN